MININGIEWFIIAVPANNSKLYKKNGELSLAVCDANDKTIYLNRTLKGEMLKKVLRHEIAHAVIFSYNIKLPMEEEELFADLIASHGNEIISISNKIIRKLKLGGRFF